MRVRSFEHEGDVLRFHAWHAHVPGGRATVDRRDVILSEAKQREELDRRAGVCHRDSDMIRIEYRLVAPCHQPSARGQGRLAVTGAAGNRRCRACKATSSLRRRVGGLAPAGLLRGGPNSRAAGEKRFRCGRNSPPVLCIACKSFME